MRTLVLCDDHYHPASTARVGLAELGNCGFEFDWVENADEWSAERMAGYPLVVLKVGQRPGDRSASPGH